MRISSGKWKRTPLPVIDLSGLRPTGSRVRETVFDWLNFMLPGFSGRRALDMFAGSGALGLEFASRGGVSVLIEKDPKNAKNLRAVCEKLKAGDDARVLQGDSIALLSGSSVQGEFDVIFIDPPFSAGLFQKALAKADEKLSADGLVYLETPEEAEVSIPEPFLVLREGKAGAVRYRVLTRKTSSRTVFLKEQVSS